MRFSATTLLITALAWFTTVTAHNIQLRSHSRECFHESLHKDDKMTVSFQVGDREFGGSGNLEIDFWVGSPDHTSRSISGVLLGSLKLPPRRVDPPNFL